MRLFLANDILKVCQTPKWKVYSATKKIQNGKFFQFFFLIKSIKSLLKLIAQNVCL
jgi:hypothetical protein